MTCQHCDKDVLARGLCSAHYNRQWRHGSLERKVNRWDPDPKDGFWERVDATTRERLNVA